mmetsp:Transcript_8089/g.18341  ORF Transcript_8089/g.18341 Transcript_8089/m.18341 type:complete len:342 (+) Transcript_8089:276-1301(+)
MSSPMTIVSDPSIVVLTSVLRKSMETSGSYVISRTPFIGPDAAASNALFTASALIPFLTVLMTRSTTDTFGVGTRSAMPLSLPFIWGSTSATAFAAPVEVGTMFIAAARARRRSRCDASSRRWSPVYECVVVIVPLTTPNSASSTLTNGARQLVVHEALEMMGACGSKSSSALTPMTYVGMSSPFAGAVMSTFLAPASMCLPAPLESRNTPVPSMMRSTFMSFHGSCAGSRLATTLISFPSTVNVSSSTILISASNVPRSESYLSRCTAGLTPPDWLTATISRFVLSPRECRQRTKLRPMRPKPLIATRSFIEACAPLPLEAPSVRAEEMERADDSIVMEL